MENEDAGRVSDQIMVKVIRIWGAIKIQQGWEIILILLPRGGGQNINTFATETIFFLRNHH